ncbi:MAG: GMC family oxidoreductase [Nitrososphaerota archaeon]|nr:GMC family oxidoreductase [Nitrososphaerota archaeon]
MNGTFLSFSPLHLKADVVVIGSGAGGASVADVLTKAGLDVIMVEEGPYMPASRTMPRASQSFQAMYRNGGLTAALGKPPVAYAEGRCVGGSTEINSGIIQRIDPQLLVEWAKKYRIAGFGESELAPFYQRAEDVVNASLCSDDLGPPSVILQRGGERKGWAVSALKRAVKDCVGTNMCAFGCPTGAKQSMSSTLLPLALNRGMRLLANTRVTRLVRKGNRISGIQAWTENPITLQHYPVRIEAQRFFVCAGAVHSPVLLRRSGITRHIGNSLRLHPTIKCISLFDEKVKARAHRLPLYAITEFMPDERIGGSVFTPALFALSLAEDWVSRGNLMHEMDQCAIYYSMIRAKGRGMVRGLPGVKEPLVFYKMTDMDYSALKRSLVHMTDTLFAAGAKRVIPSISGHPGWSSMKECAQESEKALSVTGTNLMTIHMFSSCPPGEDEALCATDSFGAVRGFDNLYIADASLIPEAPGCNPQATVMALAFRAAEYALMRPDRR